MTTFWKKIWKYNNWIWAKESNRPGFYNFNIFINEKNLFRFYVRRSGGLFPAYLLPNSGECAKVANLYKIFGIFLAKVIQDGRLVDIPLSKVFLKLLLSPEVCFFFINFI